MKNFMQYIENVFFHFVECEREWCWQISWCGIGKFISMLCRYFSVLPPSFRHWEEKSHKVYLKFMLTVDVREVQAVFGNFVAFLDLLSTPTMKESMPWRNIYYDGEIKHARNHFVAFLRTHSEIELGKEDGRRKILFLQPISRDEQPSFKFSLIKFIFMIRII